MRIKWFSLIRITGLLLVLCTTLLSALIFPGVLWGRCLSLFQVFDHLSF